MRGLEQSRGRGGFTIVEVAIGATLLLVLGASIVESTGSMKRMALTSSAQDQLHVQARRALGAVTDDLRRSGFIDVDGLDYPHFFNGTPDEMYAAQDHAHEQPTKLAKEGELDWGENREVLFLLPSDIDNNGEPDIHPVTGDLMWDADNLVSFAVVDGNDGRPSLIRRESDGAVRVVARDVERFYIESHSVDGQLLPNTVRVEIYFRSFDSDGIQYKYRVESWISLRNGTDI